MKSLSLLFGSCLIAAALQAQIIHVPADYLTIQQGIDAAKPGDTVLVSDGMYYEQINFKGKKPLIVASLYLLDGDTMHIANTIISGGHTTTPGNASVVYFISGEDNTSVLCGFTIRNGKGTLADNIIQGGGIWISGSGAMIRNNIIIANKCEDYSPSTHAGCRGGGIAVDSVQNAKWVILENNRIDNNSVITDKPNTICCGGGIAAGAKIKILSNSIKNNMAERTVTSGGIYVAGGGLICYGNLSWLIGVQSVITGNTIEGNKATGNLSIGGGMYFSGVLLTCSNNTLQSNQVKTITPYSNLGGGGMAAGYCLTGSTISDNLFKNNSSEGWAGALHIEDYATANHVLQIEKNYFLENQAEGLGGALGVYNCRVKLVNNVFSHNSASRGGVGYIDRANPNPDEHYAWLINNTFSHNQAGASVGALEFLDSNPLIMNSIFWENEAAYIPEIRILSGFAEIAYSDIETAGISGTVYAGPGNITSDPIFSDTLHLIPEHWSPCVDAGTGSYTCMHNSTLTAPLDDMAGSWRPKNNKYDIGAFELGHMIHVPADFPTIQNGVTAALPGDTVLVTNGLYYEQINFQGKKPLMVASEFLVDGDTSHIVNTIIDGSQAANPDSASVVYFISGEDTTSIICGFTIRGGKGSYTANTYMDRDGGGIWISNSGAKIIHNKITQNVIDDSQPVNGANCYGAGICSDVGDLDLWIVIDGNTIEDNTCISKNEGSEGAGICTYYNSRISNNIIKHNSIRSYSDASGWAAGISCEGDRTWDRTMNVINNLIQENSCEGQIAENGGVLFANVKGCFIDNQVVKNTAISPNANESGKSGGLYLWDINCDFTIEGNTFRANSVSCQGGAIVIESDLEDPYKVLLKNNYIIDNSARIGGGLYILNSPVILHNNVMSGNSAKSDGGACYIWKADSLIYDHMVSFINNSFSDNYADTLGGALYVYGDKPMLLNSVIWDNPDMTGNEIVVVNGFAEVAYSDLDTTKISGDKLIGAGVITADPLFIDTELLTTMPFSPCVDAGAASFVCNCGDIFSAPSNDITGVPRPAGSGYDIGAYDRTFSGVGIRKMSVGSLTIWPNPFSVSTSFSYTLAESSQVKLQIFDSFGQLLDEPVNGNQSKGEQKIDWKAGNLPSGIYFYRLTTGHNGKTVTGKLVLAK
ncbi:MAG: choice-of-anchor Q domain-containing protein [Bacteroidota bacterium]